MPRITLTIKNYKDRTTFSDDETKTLPPGRTLIWDLAVAGSSWGFSLSPAGLQTWHDKSVPLPLLKRFFGAS